MSSQSLGRPQTLTCTIVEGMLASYLLPLPPEGSGLRCIAFKDLAVKRAIVTYLYVFQNRLGEYFVLNSV